MAHVELLTDVVHVHNSSLWFDLRLIARTFWVVLTVQWSYRPPGFSASHSGPNGES